MPASLWPVPCSGTVAVPCHIVLPPNTPLLTTRSQFNSHLCMRGRVPTPTQPGGSPASDIDAHFLHRGCLQSHSILCPGPDWHPGHCPAPCSRDGFQTASPSPFPGPHLGSLPPPWMAPPQLSLDGQLFHTLACHSPETGSQPDFHPRRLLPIPQQLLLGVMARPLWNLGLTLITFFSSFSRPRASG